MEMGGVEHWVGKEVVVELIGEEADTWHGALQDWDERGVVLHFHEAAIRPLEEQGETRGESMPHKPMLLLFPWSQVRFVGIFVDDL